MQRGVVRAGMQIGSPIYLNVSLKQNDSMLQIMMGAVTKRDLDFSVCLFFSKIATEISVCKENMQFLSSMF